MSEALLDVRGLRVQLPTDAGLVTVVDGVDYHVQSQQVFGVAGESGSGKTMSVLALLGLLPNGAVVEGEALFGGVDLLKLPKQELRKISGRDVAMVFQDPMTSLHPMLTIGTQLTEHTRRHLGLSKREANARGADILAQVQIPDPAGALTRYAHQFSGGMRQRIAIAIALACDPKIIIADEPTTALDVTVQAGILHLLDRLRSENGLSVMLISHDLGVLSSVADTVSIFYAGRVVESGSKANILRRPRHPYTRGLLAALPNAEHDSNVPLIAIRGAPPTPHAMPPGCAFHPRCAHASDRSRQEVPELVRVGHGHWLACHVDPFRGETV